MRSGKDCVVAIVSADQKPPVAQLASQVDFDIWVVDDRDAYASAQRFPTARRRIVGDIGASLEKLRALLGNDAPGAGAAIRDPLDALYQVRSETR